MRRWSIQLAALSLVASGMAWGGIEGSKHDFSDQKWSGGDSCSVCHTPHNADALAAVPLWDQKADLTRRFGSSSQRIRSLGPGTATCLRCHDGTVALETLGGTNRERFANKENPGMFSVGHGTSDHPVGVVYPQFDRGFRPITAVLASGTVSLPNGRVDCVSCHDPHDQSGLPYMLVTSNARSALCRTCHAK